MDKTQAINTLEQAQRDIATIIAQVGRSDWRAARRGCEVVATDLEGLGSAIDY